MEKEPNNSNKIVFRKEDFFLIPNIITYFRMICIPVFCVLCLLYGFKYNCEGGLIYWAFGIFWVAAVSDLIDGKIARKYNMISDIGKVFDPLADKLMHVCVLICLTIIGFTPWYFIGFICLKELVMVALSPVFVKRRIIIPAVMMGKIASAEISFAVCVAFFRKLLFVDYGIYIGNNEALTPDWFLLLLGCVLAAIAAGTYIVIGAKLMKIYRKRLANGEIDKYGRLLDADGNVIPDEDESLAKAETADLNNSENVVVDRAEADASNSDVG